MLLNILIAALMMVITTAIHAGGMILTFHAIRLQIASGKRHTRIYWVSGVILIMFLASLLEVMIWAAAYLALNALQDFEAALYFSTVTFTTLGYGDIVFDEQWRLLASFEAVNGIILFGWTTAIVIAVVHRVYLGGAAELPG